jgi:hypothetical protein
MKVRYGRLWGLGNFENEKVELERDFPDAVTYPYALGELMKQVEKDHEIRVKIREVQRRIESLTSDFSYYPESSRTEYINGQKKQLAEYNKLLRKLNKRLQGI